MSFWNPWTDTTIANTNNNNNKTSNNLEQTNQNENEGLNRLLHNEIFNNLDTSNLNDKFTFLDDTSNQLLVNESLNYSKHKEAIEIKEEQESYAYSNQYQQTNQISQTPFVSNPYPYLVDDYYTYPNYQSVHNTNNLRPSSVLSSVSSNDYTSDFDSSSISSTNTSTDGRRYSPNNVTNQHSAYMPYQTYSDSNGLYNYGYEHYYPTNIDPNYYFYYNNNQNYKTQMKPPESTSLSRSQSTQSITLFKPVKIEQEIIEQKPDPDLLLTKKPTQFNHMSNTKSNAKKPTQIQNVNALTSFNYPNTTKTNPNIKIHLQDYDLWMQFKKLGTEMIITKPGRRMFPVLRFSITGLNENKRYVVFVDIQPTESENRYKYAAKTGWIKVNKSDIHTNKIYIHPDTPMMGSILKNQVLSFHKIKLTNSVSSNESMITLNSMHRYIPRLHVIEEGESVTTFNLDDCIFYAVTSYQNDMVTKLKIQHNPYAKGFKEHIYKDAEKAKIRREDYEHEIHNLCSKPKLD